MSTVQDISRPGWFCKINNILLESTIALFSVLSVNRKKKICKNAVYTCEKNVNFYVVTCLLINY